MNWGLVKNVAIKAAPIVLGMVIGSGSTMAVQDKQTTACPPVTVTCTPSVTIKEPKPINMLLKCPK